VWILLKRFGVDETMTIATNTGRSEFGIMRWLIVSLRPTGPIHLSDTDEIYPHMATQLGFIGFGIMGQRLLTAAQNHDPAVISVSGIFDPSPTAASRLNQIDSTLVAHSSVEDVIAASDCLHIASPPLSHLAYLSQCNSAGKAALCEKPLAVDVDQATNVVAALVADGFRAGVNFPFASSFAVDYLSTWLASGFVGEPRSVEIELNFATWPRSWQRDAIAWLDRRAEGGFCREVGSHFLFLSRRLLGPLQLTQAQCRYPDQVRSEDQIQATLIAGKVPVTLVGQVGKTDSDDLNTWTVTGDRGRMRLRNWSIAEQEIDGRWQAPADALPNEKARPLILARQLDKVAAMSRGENTNLASLSEALEVQQIVEAILESPDA